MGKQSTAECRCTRLRRQLSPSARWLLVTTAAATGAARRVGLINWIWNSVTKHPRGNAAVQQAAWKFTASAGVLAVQRLVGASGCAPSCSTHPPHHFILALKRALPVCQALQLRLAQALQAAGRSTTEGRRQFRHGPPLLLPLPASPQSMARNICCCLQVAVLQAAANQHGPEAQAPSAHCMPHLSVHSSSSTATLASARATSLPANRW